VATEKRLLTHVQVRVIRAQANVNTRAGKAVTVEGGLYGALLTMIDTDGDLRRRIGRLERQLNVRDVCERVK